MYFRKGSIVLKLGGGDQYPNVFHLLLELITLYYLQNCYYNFFQPHELLGLMVTGTDVINVIMLSRNKSTSSKLESNIISL